jgi:hypothetical protein
MASGAFAVRRSPSSTLPAFTIHSLGLSSASESEQRAANKRMMEGEYHTTPVRRVGYQRVAVPLRNG